MRTSAGPVVSRAPSSQKLHGFTHDAPLRRVTRPVYALTASGLPFGPPDSLAYACDASGLPALRAGILGRATPAGLRPSVIGPHLRPLSSAGITPRLQSYGPLRHPADPAFPSQGSGSPRARHRRGFPCCYAFHLPYVPTPLPRRKPAVLSLLSSHRSAAFPLTSQGRLPRFAFSRPAQRSLHVSAHMVAEPPEAALLPECFSPRRYLRKPPWLLVGATATGWDSHLPGIRAFPRHTTSSA